MDLRTLGTLFAFTLIVLISYYAIFPAPEQECDMFTPVNGADLGTGECKNYKSGCAKPENEIIIEECGESGYVDFEDRLLVINSWEETTAHTCMEKNNHVVLFSVPFRSEEKDILIEKAEIDFEGKTIDGDTVKETLSEGEYTRIEAMEVIADIGLIGRSAPLTLRIYTEGEEIEKKYRTTTWECKNIHIE